MKNNNELTKKVSKENALTEKTRNMELESESLKATIQ